MRPKQPHAKPSMPRTGRSSFGSDGTALVEFALAAPILVTLVLGIADFGLLAAKNAALEGATRVGAEYARDNSTCQSNIQATSCISGIKTAMQSGGNFSPALTFPSSSPPFPASCECDDGTSITCGTTCVGAGKTPNRVLVTVTATQAYTPILPWPGIPTSLTASTELRIQ
jgi:Flp pilus assembly protein TadG